jgi:hypothetical protein
MAAETTSTIAIFIPIIFGGLIGFLASVATSYFGHNRTQKALIEDRTRARLEELYKTLVKISREVSSKNGEALSHVHFSTKIEKRELEDFPPHFNLEMLVGLYFKDFKELHNRFTKAQDNFILKYIDIVGQNFSSKSEEEKKSICTELAKLEMVLDAVIMAMQAKICETIEI